MAHGTQKKEELLAQAAAVFVNHESNRESLITVMRAELSTDEKRATIFVSVLPTTYEDHALDFLKRKRAELRAYVQKQVRLRVIPFFEFALDYGEKNRQHIDILSNQG